VSRVRASSLVHACASVWCRGVMERPWSSPVHASASVWCRSRVRGGRVSRVRASSLGHASASVWCRSRVRGWRVSRVRASSLRSRPPIRPPPPRRLDDGRRLVAHGGLGGAAPHGIECRACMREGGRPADGGRPQSGWRERVLIRDDGLHCNSSCLKHPYTPSGRPRHQGAPRTKVWTPSIALLPKRPFTAHYLTHLHHTAAAAFEVPHNSSPSEEIGQKSHSAVVRGSRLERWSVVNGGA
jgi:hypothetical protein